MKVLSLPLFRSSTFMLPVDSFVQEDTVNFHSCIMM